MSSRRRATVAVTRLPRAAQGAAALMIVAPAVVVPGALNRFVFGKLAVAVTGVGIASLCDPAGRLRREIAAILAAGGLVLLVAGLGSAQPVVAVLGRAPRYEGVFVLASYALLAWAGARIFGPACEPRLVLLALRMLAVVAVLIAIVATLEAFGLRPLSTDVARPGSLLGNASDEGAVGVLCLGPLGLVGLRRRDGVLGVGAAAAIVMSALSGSRAAIVAAFVEVVILGVAIGGRKAAAVLATGVGSLAVLVFAVPSSRDRFLDRSPLAAHTVTGRRLLWQETLRLDRSHLWLGVGPSNYKAAIVGYHDLAWQQRVGPQDPPDSPHSWPLQALSAGGLPLLLLAITFAVVILIMGFRRVQRSADSDLPFVAGCAVALTGYGVVLMAGVTSCGPMVLAALFAGSLLSVRPSQRNRARSRWSVILAATTVFALGAVLGLAAAAEVPLRHAIVDVSQGHDAAADRAFDVARDLRPWDVDIEDLAGHAFVTAAVNDGNAGAISYGAQWLARVPGDLATDEQVQLDRATLAETMHQYGRAVTILTVVLANDEDNPLVLLQRGVVEAEDATTSAAERDFLAVTRIVPSDPAPWHDLAVLYQQAGHPHQAELAQARADALAANDEAPS